MGSEGGFQTRFVGTKTFAFRGLSSVNESAASKGSTETTVWTLTSLRKSVLVLFVGGIDGS